MTDVSRSFIDPAGRPSLGKSPAAHLLRAEGPVRGIPGRACGVLPEDERGR
jgi:hypothetical protein